MPRSADLRKWAVAALLILHVAWIANHMRLVADEQIDPWKLGGYAMYTVPPLIPRFLVYDPASPEAGMQISLTRYLAEERFTNPGRVFRCLHMNTGSLQALFKENRHLVGRNFMLFISEREFVRKPPSVTRRIRGMVQVTWRDAQTFTYVSKICGAERTRTARLS